MKILVTTDGSPRSLHVLPHAARLAKAADGEVLLVRVLSPLLDLGGVRAPSVEEAIPVVTAEWLGELNHEVANLGVPARGLVAVQKHSEEVPETLLRTIAELEADVIAMGSRGAGFLRHAVLGSVAMSVLRHAPIPMLVVGDRVAGPRSEDPYRILVTTDGSEGAGRAVRAVARLCEDNALQTMLLTVRLLRSGHTAKSNESAAAAALEQARQTFADPSRVESAVRNAVGLDGVDDAVLRFATEFGASAIAIATHGHSAKYHAFMGSTGVGLLQRSTLPLLLVRSSPDA